MAANPNAREDRVQDGVSVSDVLSTAESVLIQGPAMSGKQEIGIELLSATDQGGGQPFAISTADTADQLREAYRSVGGGTSDNLAVVNCLPMDSKSTEWTTSVESPGALTSIAMAISKAIENTPERRRDGGCLLVDNAATMLMYADIEPVYRFLHAIVNQMERNGGSVVVTLDDDGVEKSDVKALVGLFERVVETRRSDGATEFRTPGHETIASGWHRYDSPGGGRE